MQQGGRSGRVARQRKLLKAVIAQTKDLQNAWWLPKVIDVTQEAVVTDRLASDMMRPGLTFRSVTDAEVTTVMFPGIPRWVDGTSYVIPYAGPMAEEVAPCSETHLSSQIRRRRSCQLTRFVVPAFARMAIAVQ